MADNTFVQVPNLSASSLVAGVARYSDILEVYLNWDFMKDEAGKRYEVMTHAFKRDVTADEVRVHFKDLGFHGNTAAFIAWIMYQKPDGCFASFPDDDRLWRDPESSTLVAPNFRNDDGGRTLALGLVDGQWDDGWTFVAFRESPTP